MKNDTTIVDESEWAWNLGLQTLESKPMQLVKGSGEEKKAYLADLI